MVSVKSEKYFVYTDEKKADMKEATNSRLLKQQISQV